MARSALKIIFSGTSTATLQMCLPAEKKNLDGTISPIRAAVLRRFLGPAPRPHPQLRGAARFCICLALTAQRASAVASWSVGAVSRSTQVPILTTLDLLVANHQGFGAPSYGRATHKQHLVEGFRRAIAQLAEHRSPKPKVGGSSPSCPAGADR